MLTNIKKRSINLIDGCDCLSVLEQSSRRESHGGEHAICSAPALSCSWSSRDRDADQCGRDHCSFMPESFVMIISKTVQEFSQ